MIVAVIFQPKQFCAGVAGATLPTVGDKTSLGAHWQVGSAGAGESLLWPYPTLTDVLSPVIHILGALEIEHWNSVFKFFGDYASFGIVSEAQQRCSMQAALLTSAACCFISWMGFRQCWRKDWMWREIASILIALMELEHSGWLLTLDNSSLQCKDGLNHAPTL